MVRTAGAGAGGGAAGAAGAGAGGGGATGTGAGTGSGAGAATGSGTGSATGPGGGASAAGGGGAGSATAATVASGWLPTPSAKPSACVPADSFAESTAAADTWPGWTSVVAVERPPAAMVEANRAAVRRHAVMTPTLTLYPVIKRGAGATAAWPLSSLPVRSWFSIGPPRIQSEGPPDSGP